MITAMGLAAWRAALLVALGLFPWGAPLDAPSTAAATTFAAIVRLVLAIALLAAGAFYVRRVRAREPWALVAGVALAAGVALLAGILSGDRGPIARGAWVASPLAWLFVAVLAADLMVRALDREGARGRVRAWLAGIAIVVSGASLAAARGRLGPREHVWNEVLASDPGNEPAALAVASATRAAGDRAASLATLKACAEASAASCRCAEAGAGDAIELGEYATAKSLLDASGACDTTWTRAGEIAEARAGTGDLDGALAQVGWVLSRKADEPHALYAQGWVAWLRGDGARARPSVEKAVALGRGVPADLLLGTILFQQGDVPGADRAFRAALTVDPKNVRATYDLAYLAQRRGAYHDAREGYLQTLRLDPKYLDARYNLVILTHDHGADAEAQHHFVEFALAAPNDPRVAQLRAILATPVR